MSSPFIGFQFFDEIKRFAEVTLVTRERYRKNLEALQLKETIHFIENQPGSQLYFSLLSDKLFRVFHPLL